MTRVYSNAFINIAAAYARDRTHGCFVERDPAAVKPTEIYVEWGPRPGVFHVVDIDSMEHDVDHAPLHKRSWVVQERLLARRNLHCCKSQLFWECKEMEANETLPNGLARPISTDGHWVGMTNDLDKQSTHQQTKRKRLLASEHASVGDRFEYYRLWSDIVSRYSPCGLTFATDKLVALSGLASRMHRFMKCRYLAGLWEDHLSYQLLWAGHDEVEPPRRPEIYVAPSWSWASVNGAVVNVAGGAFPDGRDIMIEIVDIQISLLSTKHVFGQVTGGHLLVEGVLAKQNISVASPEASEVGHHPWARVNGLFLTRPYMDDAHYEVEGKDLYFMPVRFNLGPLVRDTRLHVEGIVLEHTGKQPDEYRRVGKFDISNGGITRLDADQGAVEAFKEACVLTSGPGGPGRFGDWGKKRTLTII